MMRPFITMQGQAKDALDFYQAVFPSFEMISLQHHSEPHQNLIMLAVFSVDEQEIMISDSFITHDWEINPGISFFINLEQEEELHKLAEQLGAMGISTCHQVTMDFRNSLPGWKISLGLIGS